MTKKIRWAPSERLAKLSDRQIGDFMARVFGMRAGDYLLTDKSRLGDFVPMGDDAELERAWARVTAIYGLPRELYPSGVLVDIMMAIYYPPGTIYSGGV
jgi:hypothetical protein